MGVLIQMLGGNEGTIKALESAKGRTIESASVADDALTLTFADGSALTMRDEGQSCCESRYMRTDDNLGDFAGATFVGAEIRQAPDVDDDYGSHEVQFLVIQTDRGNLTCSNHNEHNGYYGGFWITAQFVPPQTTDGPDGVR